MSEQRDVEARLAEIEAAYAKIRASRNYIPSRDAHEGFAQLDTDLPALLAVARAAAALLYDAPWIPESTQVRPYAERVHLALAALGGQGQEAEK
jgi:hypothetical protein